MNSGIHPGSTATSNGPLHGILPGLLLLFGCQSAPEPPPPPPAEPPALTAQSVVARYQCNRCHEAPGRLEPIALERGCVDCHAAIFTDHFEDDYTAEALTQWRSRVHSLRIVPSLTGSQRLQADWLHAFLSRTHELSPDLRPNLPANMPRLPLTPEERTLVVDWLGGAAPDSTPYTEGDVARGILLLTEKECTTCHQYTGIAAGPTMTDFNPAWALAPDLAHTRARMAPSAIDAWLTEPTAIKPGTLMPKPALTPSERADLIAALTRAKLPAPTPVLVPERLPILERKVGFLEVYEKVFAKVCQHCHSTPSNENQGDGGPGRSGGFGYDGVGLDLSNYMNVLAGRIDAKGQHISVLEGDPPPIVAAMLRRHQEIAGQSTTSPGMPLGLEPIDPVSIQLVETWIAQGAQY